MPAGSDLWRHRAAAPLRFRDRVLLGVFTGVGLIAVIRFGNWWFRADHVAQPILYTALTLSVWYGVGRIVVGWINYLALSRPAPRDAPAGLRVAIFTTSARGEPLEMFERTLAACARIRYPHVTYLLDDTGDPAFRELAGRHNAVWLELSGTPGAKAGKINRALGLTEEEFILVLDPDHVPFPEFLDRVLGHFDDPHVGFVQVAQAYYNQVRSFTAAAAAEQTYAFYGPGMIGLNGHGACVAIGANCTFRRAALHSIGGHGIGLAEDLVTAIRLHAEGWRSVYVPEVVSRGLVPEDLDSYNRQQLKWARGVYEVAFSELPRLFHRLSWRQRIAYLTIGSYYLYGGTTLAYLVIPYLYLWTGLQPTTMRFAEFLSYGTPVAVVGIGIYAYAQRWLCHRRVEWGLHWRGGMLKVATWPLVLAGTVLAVLRRDVPYVPTAKKAVRSRFLRLAWPHFTLLAFFLMTAWHVITLRLIRFDESEQAMTAEAVWGMLAFAAIPVVIAVVMIRTSWEAAHPPEGAPWDAMDVTTLGGEAS